MSHVELFPDERLDRVNEHLSLIRKTNGLTFGTDAYLLAAFTRPKPHGTAIELGTGTGIVSLLLATRKRFETIHALELQEDFAELAKRNVLLNDLGERVTVHHTDVRQARPEEFGGEVDAVLANPPYMRTDSGARNESEYLWRARHEVSGGIADFCAAASRLLKHGGKFTCVWRPDRLPELILALESCRLAAKRMILVHGDETCAPSMILVEAIKGGAPGGLRILPPLLLHDSADRCCGGRALSPRAERIYDTMCLYDGQE